MCERERGNENGRERMRWSGQGGGTERDMEIARYDDVAL